MEHRGNYSLRLAITIKTILEGSPSAMTTAEITAAVMLRRSDRLNPHGRQTLRRNIVRIGKTLQSLGQIDMELIPTVAKGKTYLFTLIRPTP